MSFTLCLLSPIQTYIGSVLVSVNPYKTIADLYGPSTMEQYRGVNFYELPPHVWVLLWAECERSVALPVDQDGMLYPMFPTMLWLCCGTTLPHSSSASLSVCTGMPYLTRHIGA